MVLVRINFQIFGRGYARSNLGCIATVGGLRTYPIYCGCCRKHFHLSVFYR